MSSFPLPFESICLKTALIAYSPTEPRPNVATAATKSSSKKNVVFILNFQASCLLVSINLKN
ncbi:hypothetical protein BpHYR1_012205 [Brachionus plicatilis]|uniref:Uncharacterized protein n=1 Tax=Brachionus plicatilis TaxID=10195 RepID=A0A3M7RF61_BRAPC|nr:hypothetical protein BpHYR1_012205 [Brachionus plicatilis]